MSVRVKWTHRHFTDEIRFYFSPLTLKLSFYFISCNLFLKIFIVVPPLVIPCCSRSTDKDISSQGHASDPKCKENISSFLNTSNLLDCLICTRSSMSNVLLLWMMRGWDRWGLVDSYQDVGGRTGVGIIS